MRHSIELNEKIDAITKTSIAQQGDHKKFTGAGNKIGQVATISFHKLGEPPIRVHQLVNLKSVDQQPGGKRNVNTARHVTEGMKRDGIWNKKENPESHIIFDHAVADGINTNLRDEGWERPEEHLGECQGHNLNNFKKNMYKKMDELLDAEKCQGMFISKLIYIKFI